MTFERPNIQAMRGYSYGEQPQAPGVVKLNTNENPYPPSPAVETALAAFSTADLRRYPPATADAFREAAATLHGVGRDNIIATRGGDELLRLVITTFADPGEVIAVTDPTYSLYPVLAQIQNCPVHSIPLEPDWSLPEDFAEQANRAGAKLTFVVNPHAPSGQLLPAGRIRRLAAELDSLLLVDEAYVDFVSPGLDYPCLDLASSASNVIFLRTLSKGYGLAGLRFGYGIAHKQLISPMLSKTRDSYNLDAISQVLAVAALGDQAYAEKTWQAVRAERATLARALAGLNCAALPSEANFLLVSVPGAAQVYEALRQANIYVRYFNSPGLEDKLRISVGTPEENERLLGELRRILST